MAAMFVVDVVGVIVIMGVGMIVAGVAHFIAIAQILDELLEFFAAD